MAGAEAHFAGPDSADAFVAGFEALAAAIRRARGARAEDERALTLSQFALLEPLGDGEARRVRDLAAVAGIQPSTATRILDVLERRCLVARTRADHDRRGVVISLTAAGEDALTRQREWLRGRQRAFYGALPEVEQAVAPDLLVRLAGLIDEIAGGPA